MNKQVDIYIKYQNISSKNLLTTLQVNQFKVVHRMNEVSIGASEHDRAGLL